MNVPKVPSPLLLNTTLNSLVIHIVAFNFEYLVDVETFLNLVNTSPILSVMNNLMGLAHA